MAFNFPNAPTLGQEFAPPGGPVYTWDGTKWGAQFAGGGLDLDEATVADTRASTPNKVFTTGLLEQASAFVALVDAETIALDWDSAINFSVTLEGNRTLANPTNGQPGTWRTILVTQDAVGGRTLAFGSQYKFPYGLVPIISTEANAIDMLVVFCVSPTNFYLFYNQSMA